MRKIVFLLLALSFAATQASAQNEKFKAVFIYNFTKNIEWPPQMRTGDFEIAVLGSSPIEQELRQIAETKMVGNQRIVVRQYAAVSQVRSCHLLFIPSSKSGSLAEARQHLRQGTLIVTDKPGMGAQGAGINFVQDGSRLLFEINRDELGARGLNVTNSLVELGTLVP